MPLPANSLMQSAWHVTAYVHIHFWILMYEYNSDNPCSIEYRFHSLPAYWHTTFCGCQCRWMCPLPYSWFWVKWWTHVSQRHHGFREPVCSYFKWLKKWKSTYKHTFLWNSIKFLGTHHAHTLLYLSCTWTTFGTVFIDHSSAVDKSCIVSWWFFKKTSFTTCTVFTRSWSAGLKGIIFMMDANPLLNSLYPLPKRCHLSTPSPNTSINWQWISRVEMFFLCKLSQHKVSTIITTAHKLIP